MLRQSQFGTLQSARDVIVQLYLPKSEQAVRGSTFTLTLCVEPVSAQAEMKKLDIIVDRLDENESSIHYELPDKTWVSNTVARIEPDGEPFDIAVIFDRNRIAHAQQLGESIGASVRTSDKMVEVLRKQLSDFYDRELDSFLHGE